MQAGVFGVFVCKCIDSHVLGSRTDASLASMGNNTRKKIRRGGISTSCMQNATGMYGAFRCSVLMKNAAGVPATTACRTQQESNVHQQDTEARINAFMKCAYLCIGGNLIMWCGCTKPILLVCGCARPKLVSSLCTKSIKLFPGE